MNTIKLDNLYTIYRLVTTILNISRRIATIIIGVVVAVLLRILLSLTTSIPPASFYTRISS